MATLTSTKLSSPVVQVKRENTPRDLVQDVFTRPKTNWVQLLWFDLAEWSTEAIAKWNEEFIELYDEMTFRPGEYPLPPSVVVFGDRVDPRTQEYLRRAGALVYDRTVEGNPRNGQDLLAHLQKAQGILPYAQVAATSVSDKVVAQIADDLPQVDPKADPTAFNGYAPGVSQEDMDRWIEAMNRSRPRT